MIQITPHMRVLLAREALDFRRGIDGTAALCRNELQHDPMSGVMFVFRNKMGTMLRALVYDGQGYWLMTKRLSSGRFRFWCERDSAASVEVRPHELATLLAGGDFRAAKAPSAWRPVAPRMQCPRTDAEAPPACDTAPVPALSAP